MSRKQTTKRSKVLLSFALASSLAFFGTAGIALAEEENTTQENPAPVANETLATQDEPAQLDPQTDDRWSVSGTTLTIGKDNTTVTFEEWTAASDVPWSSVAKDIETVEVKGTVKVASCSWMFKGFEKLTTLDLTNLEAKDVDAENMFSGCKILSEITLPGDSKFKLNKDKSPAFPSSTSDPYTGVWSDGTEAKSPSELYEAYTKEQATARTWKWQQRVTPEYQIVVSGAEYNAKAHEPKPAVTLSYEGQTLAKGTDYTFSVTSYENNVNAGTGIANVSITPLNDGGYYVFDAFTNAAEFTISPRPITLTVKDITKEYDGYLTEDKQATPAYSVSSKNKVSSHKVKVSLSTKYKKGENDGVGSYKVSIAKATITDADGNEVGSYSADEASTQAVNNYAFTVEDGTLKVTAKDINPENKTNDTVVATVSAISDRIYTGKDIEPLPVVKMATTTLKRDEDYTLSYKNNKEVGKATVTITGKGNYTGTKEVNFNIKKNTSTATRTTSSVSRSSTPSTSDSTIGVVGIVVAGVGIVIAALVLRRRKSE